MNSVSHLDTAAHHCWQHSVQIAPLLVNFLQTANATHWLLHVVQKGLATPPEASLGLRPLERQRTHLELQRGGENHTCLCHRVKTQYQGPCGYTDDGFEQTGLRPFHRRTTHNIGAKVLTDKASSMRTREFFFMFTKINF